MKNERGNALFLILIAVALFAALSYAVTSSGRGGSGIDREQADIYAAQIMNEVALYRSEIQRLKIIGGYDQVLFDDSAETTSGTCYNGGNTISNCHTIGLFSDGTLTPPIVDVQMRDPATTNNKWGWQSRRLLIDGVDVGSSDPDVIFHISGLSQEVCEAINRKAAGISTISDYLGHASDVGYSYILVQQDSTFFHYSTTAANLGFNLPNPGCSSSNGSGNKGATFVIEEN